MRISDWSSDVCSSDLCAWANLATLKKSALRRVSSRSLLPVSVPARGMVTSSFEPDRSAGSKLSRVEKPGKVPVNTSPSYLVAMIGRTHVCTPVTNAQHVCRLLLASKNIQIGHNHSITQ